MNNYKDVSEKTRAKILQAAAEMDYLPNAHAQSLSTKKSWAIGVTFSEANEVGMKHPFFNGIIESFRHATEEHGYDLIFASRNLRNRDMSYLEHFKHRAVDGIVVICSDRMDEQVQELMQSDIPIVVIDMDSANCSVVYSDNSEGARMAVNYLYKLGHRAIAHIAGDSSIDAGAARVKGYELAMHALDLPIQPGYLVNAGFFSVEEGKQAMEQLLQLPSPPTAVFVAGDQMAIGAIEAVHKHGLRVPEDISIIGYDDIEMIKYITPKLTTIRQDTDEIGEAAAELLIEQMTAKERRTERRVIPVRLIERASCAPIIK
ncbi:LacI family DNA-binding transcriptional regulator [Exiguobacterium sp. s21]|uniref:LacI family DNA-binding transcriptional regulator n=1 Tax=Exiguobacterium sp. s21 TaxID=2751244 RepID=UPI00333A750C